MDSLRLEPIARVAGTVTLPGSKSLSNRLLLLAALASGPTRIDNLLDSDDVRHMRWQGFYPSPKPPRTWSRCWGGAHTDSECLEYVLREIWAAHTRETGEECPFDLALA